MKKITILLLLSFVHLILISQSDIPEFKKAQDLYGEGKLKKAEKILKKIEKSNPDFAPCYYYLGLIYQDTEEYGKAEEYYLIAGEKDQSYGEPYSDLASLMLAQNNSEKAIEYGKISIQRDDTNAKAFINLASAQLQIGQAEEADKNFRKAAQLDPDQIIELGELMITQYNNAEFAEYYFKFAFEENPQYAPAVLNLGKLYRLTKRTEDALEVYQKGYELMDVNDKRYDYVYGSYFRILLAYKKYQEVLNTAYDRVDENFYSAHFVTALANYGLGNKEIFKEKIKKYFKLSGKQRPANLEAWAKAMLQL